ncbi:fibronectin type III domain-containing protein 7 isoform X3 [Motacilla alba alba]|uniref:fibronectin type III domain-containing protein 7 isoform X3 n=1 Tax=Motacilla alba alba TaxID=1094192 RepID=UPI0018D51782|nr:fibronectin type III domain-containing protein 7 isoform X3 [Motacilla alba alba]
MGSEIPTGEVPGDEGSPPEEGASCSESAPCNRKERTPSSPSKPSAVVAPCHPRLVAAVQLWSRREERPAQRHLLCPGDCADSDSTAGERRWAPASARPRVKLERSSDRMRGAKSQSLAFTGVLLSCLEMIFSANTEHAAFLRTVFSRFSTPIIISILAPDIPVIDQAYSKLSNSITVEWRAVPGATNYMLTAQDGDSFVETIVKNSPGTVTGLKPATLYRITVRSINSGGKSQPSPFRKVKTVLAAPILSVHSPSCDSIAVSWKAVHMAAGLSVSLMRSDGLGRMLKQNTTNSSLIFTNLDPGTLYTIKAYAWNANGMPGDDFTYNQRTKGALTYSVTVSSGLLKLRCNTSSASCMVPSLQCSSEYYVSVTAYNDAGASEPTDAVSLKTIPCAPVNISIEEDEPGHLLVSWSSVSLGHYYVVFVKSDDGLEVHCNTSHTQCHFQSDCGFTYFISVFAYNKAGQSPLGDVLNYTTAPCCPSDFRAVFISSDTVRVTWAPVRGADLYETRAAGGSGVALCRDTATACTLSALQCSTPYNITVYSFSEARGSNASCAPQYVATAPCSPEIKNISKEGLSVISVQWQPNNEEAMYVVTARGEAGLWHCTSTRNSCTLMDLPCGSAFSVSAIARSPAGQSLPSYSIPLETAPCCPYDLIVTQVTQSVTNISWSVGKGAQTYVTTLESPKGQAKCHTLQTYCLLGCITCGTNYTVSLRAISETGLTSSCTYQGYSSSACCPFGVKLYRLSNNGIRVFWRASDETINYSADLHGSKGNFSCTPSSGLSHCDITKIPCGDVYTVVVAPVTNKGPKLTFCPKKIYSVTCSGSSVGMVIYRGKSNPKHI